MSTLNQSMRPVASFVFENTDSNRQKLCLFPGHFMTASSIGIASGSSPVTVASYLSYADPSAIIAAGYDCCQVADDFAATENRKDASGRLYPIKITSKSAKTRFRDFLNYIKLANVRVTKMRITDLSKDTNPSREIFQQELEITKSSIGSKNGSDFVQLSQHINPSNFLQNFIEVDLEKQNLKLDETTLAFLDIPGSAHFQIDSTLAE